MAKPHIVILGCGFGGMYVARRLAPEVRKGTIDVTIVHRTNYFLFTPLLHEVATGGLGPMSISEPLREIFAGTGIRVRQAMATKIDGVKKQIHLEKGTLTYDTLVIATGADSNFFGTPGAREYALPLKTLQDAITIRERVIHALERALCAPTKAEKKALLSFIVVGGGATGVELMAELAEFIVGVAHRYYRTEQRPFSEKDITLTLISSGKDILSSFPPRIRSAAEKRLRAKGVTLRLETSVTAVSADGVILKDGSRIPSATVLWMAGVQPLLPEIIGPQPQVARGRLCVDSFFQIPELPKVFAMGDVAVRIVDGKPEPLPMLAQVAVAEAKTVACNVLAAVNDSAMRTFVFQLKGVLISLGQWYA
ncbi:NAD(P)/FAD-dependent oxidoreductase, partial [Patescibacteria group bacterium]|nr:NAD(P)/FAD-dependent oxidoreductase [Patescibacteria group bacterium]